MKCNINDCGGNVVDDEPHYIPLGTDMVLKITDKRCKKCGAVYVGGQYQNWREFKTENFVTNCTGFMKKTYTAKLIFE